jgi:hypothetical protein
VETFARSGALSISTVPRAETALTVAIIRVGLGGHISTKIRPFPEPFQLLLPAFRQSIDSRKHATFARFGAM